MHFSVNVICLNIFILVFILTIEYIRVLIFNVPIESLLKCNQPMQFNAINQCRGVNTKILQFNAINPCRGVNTNILLITCIYSTNANQYSAVQCNQSMSRCQHQYSADNLYLLNQCKPHLQFNAIRCK